MARTLVTLLLAIVLYLGAGFLSAQNANENDTPPADTVQADTAPADTAPTDTVPADTAPTDTAPASPAPAAGGTSLWVLIKAGGWVGAIIFLLSLAAGAVAIQMFITIRRKTLLPDELIDQFTALVEKGRLQSALVCCREHPSLLATVLTAGLKNFEAGWDDVEKGAGESLSQETARLYRRNDFLAVIGNIAPMLGLLGTVLGMVTAFGELAASDGMGRFANLAQGIYFALVTTVDGLLVAIPALALYSYFNHRVASFSAEAAELATEMFRPLKRHFLSRGSGAVPPVRPNGSVQEPAR